VRAILAAQATRAQRLAAADDVIDNGGAPQALEGQVARLHEKYLTLAARVRVTSNEPLSFARSVRIRQNSFQQASDSRASGVT